MMPYEITKFLSVAFSQNYSSSDSWKMISNDFTTAVYGLVPEYNEYYKRANDARNKSELQLRGAAVAEKELAVAEGLKKEWLGFVDRFAAVEQMFDDKYRTKIAIFQNEVQDLEFRDNFLADYSAYSYLYSAYNSLVMLESLIDNYKNQCLKFKDQAQPM